MTASKLAFERIIRAQDLVLSAQNQLLAATDELSRLRNASEIWAEGMKLHRELKAYWRRVRGISDGRKHITTDEEPLK